MFKSICNKSCLLLSTRLQFSRAVSTLPSAYQSHHCFSSSNLPYCKSKSYSVSNYKIKPSCSITNNVSKTSFIEIDHLVTSRRTFSSYSNKMAIPDGVLMDWDMRKLTPEKIEEQTTKLIAELQAIIDEVAAVPLKDATYDNIMNKLHLYQVESRNKAGPITMAQHCVEDKALRDASCKAEERLDKFDVEISMREDVFKRCQEIQLGSMDGLNVQQKRFVDKMVLQGKRCGLHLDSETQKKVKELKTKESELSIKFSSNLNEDDTKLYFKKEDLAGLPDDFINELKTNGEGLLEVTIKYNHLFPITKKCRVPETRKAIVAAANRKCMKENTPILEELVTLRHTVAQLLGYDTHAAFILDNRMAKTTQAVSSFLSGMKEKLQPLVKEEKKVMLAMKQEECEALKIPFNGQLDIWDSRYYMDMVEKKNYAVDTDVLREYFPLGRVLSGMFDIYQRLLGVTFKKVENAPVWHEEVEMHRVTDTDSGELLGYFYLDLHPRSGKYSHAAKFSLQPTCRNGGQIQTAVCAMLCNFTKPTAEKPALLEHSEVETLFHEFGHVMHHICSRVDIVMFSGTAVDRDFVEAPSQMLENWVWEKEPLHLMSEHYKTKAQIPDELLEKLRASRLANAGYLNIRQVSLATFDQCIHRSASADVAEVYARVSKEITGYEPIPDTCMPASFGHLGGGYDAQYYGYLWSEVFSMDMFATRFADNKIMDPKTGREYRAIILQKGSTEDAMELLKQFLGREPNNEAFLKSKGLTV